MALTENDQSTWTNAGSGLGPGEYNFYPDDFAYNVLPYRQAGNPPSVPRPVLGTRVPGGGVINPIEVDMMNGIRTGNNRIPASAALASAFRPS